MNTRIVWFLIFAVVGSLTCAAMPSVSVTISDTGSVVAYKGRTNTEGTFATGKLHPGEYTVQFNSDVMAKDNYAVVISAGKQKVAAEAVEGSKFARGGVAMKIKVGDGMNITGQIANGKPGAVTAKAGATQVKIINGKRWFLVRGSTGSNLGQHWVEEGTPEARNLQNLRTSEVARIQERGDFRRSSTGN